MKKVIIAALLLVVFTGCKGEAISTEKKADYELEFLFEKDGCKMYRFYDGRFVYWSDCQGKVQSDYTTSTGKSTTTHYQEAITVE